MFKASCASIMLLMALSAEAGPLMVTGIATFGGDANGNLVSGMWNTACTAGVAQLDIAGQAECPLSVDISIPGVYAFDYQRISGDLLGDPFANLLLFFNGETQMPGIHVIYDRANAILSVPSTTNQQCLAFNGDPSCNPDPVGPSSGVYTTGSYTVTLVDFTSDAQWAGRIEFSVTNPDYVVPEPGTFGLLAGGALAFAFLRRLRKAA